MYCDMCGTDAELFRCKIENTYLNVCKKCSQYGEVIHKIKEIIPSTDKKKEIIAKNELIQIINPDFSSLIKKKREALNLKQKELAQKIGEKESIIHKLESRNIEPSISLARKLEKFLNIKIVEKYEEKSSTNNIKNSQVLTIGDLFKIKK